MNGETTGLMDPISGQRDVPYEPKHVAPEVSVESLEGQARAADEFRYDQMFRQFLAEFAAEHGPFGSDDSPTRAEKFKREQRKAAADAARMQGIAWAYAMEKRIRIEAISGELSMYDEPYIGRHRKPDAEPGLLEETAQPAAASGGGPSTTLEDILEREKEEPEPEMPVVAEPEEPDESDGEPDAELSQPKRRRLRDGWYAAGAAMGSYFMHPEKRSRRQTVSVILGYAAVAAVAYLAGKGRGQFNFDWHNLIPTRPPAHVTPAQPEVQPFSEQFYDSLQPQDYHGQAYEWGAVADSVGPAHATQELVSMIQNARAHGVTVETWGGASSGHWGVSYVEVGLSGGGSKAYYDTQHKLAILQYMSELAEYDPSANLQ